MKKTRSRKSRDTVPLRQGSTFSRLSSSVLLVTKQVHRIHKEYVKYEKTYDTTSWQDIQHVILRNRPGSESGNINSFNY